MPRTPAEIEATLRSMSQISKRIADGIGSDIDALDRELVKLQRQLFELIVAEFLTGFDTDSGSLKPTAANFARVAALDRVFDRFRRSDMGKTLKEYVDKLLVLVGNVSDYFRAGFAPSRVDRIAQSNAVIESVLGIKDGKVIPGGYLDRLARMEEVRNTLKSYMVTAITNRTSLRDLTRGLSVLVSGTADADGTLQRYYRQYAYDTFNQVREVKARQFAEGLGLEWFIYQGSVIETSRKFCKKRAGKVYNVKETKKWKDDPDLIEKKTKATYNPLIERGRYNCRHWIDYISAETAAYLKQKQKQGA